MARSMQWAYLYVISSQNFFRPFQNWVKKMLLLSAVWQKERISLIKKECHCYDQEWRMLLPTPYTNRPCIKLKPKSVIIGLRTPEYHRRLIISAAKIAGIQEIYQAVINEKNLLDKERIAEE